MDLLSLGVIVLILAVSGGIAFVADGLGKKIGKKRLSVAGLRPKHVAQIGTISMGVFVSGLTIGFIMAVSGDARQWLLRGRRILTDNAALVAQNDEYQRAVQGSRDALDRLRRQSDEIEASNARLTDSNASLTSSVDEQRLALRNLQARSEELRAEKDRLGGQVTLLQGDLRGSRLALRESESGLAKTRQGLAIATANLRSYRGLVRRAKTDLLVSRSDLGVAAKNLAFANKSLKDAQMTGYQTNVENQRLEAQVSDAKSRFESLKAKQDAAEREYESAQARLVDAQAALDEVSRNVAQLTDQAHAQESFLNGAVRSSRTGAMMYGRGEEVARVVVPAGSDAAAARAFLDALLRLAREEAIARGARPRAAGEEHFEAADVMEHRDPKTKERLSPETLKARTVAGLTNARVDQVLVATSSLNAFAGEVVSLDIVSAPNPLVYRRNQTVAETEIDADQTEDRILAQLSAFYNGRVRERATQSRMVPRAGSAAPFGGLSDAEVFSLVQRVKKAGGAVRVMAVAETDLRAADPLRLEFRVR